MSNMEFSKSRFFGLLVIWVFWFYAFLRLFTTDAIGFIVGWQTIIVHLVGITLIVWSEISLFERKRNF